MATVIALVSVIASATVAICVPLLTARLEAARSAHRLRVGRIDELRSVADAASIALAAAEQALRDAALAVERAQARAATQADQDGARVAVANGIAAMEAVRQAVHRTAVRLGWDASPTRCIGAASDDLATELKVLEEVRQAGPCSDDPEAWSEVSRALEEARMRYSESRGRFYMEAAQLVGLDA